MLSVVLHPDVFQFLCTDIGNTFQESIWNCINKLRQRQFDGGLRVKRLKGVTKRVWEARINRASRLIFTYNKSRQPQTGEIKVYIAVQDICLDHDRVSHWAARVRNPDTNWLDAEEINVIGNIEHNLIELLPSERDELIYAQLEDEDLAISSDLIDELLGNIPWRVVDSLEAWQRAIINQDVDLHLKLTPEEYELATYSGNLVLKGSAGTGKTTVALHRMSQSYHQDWQFGKRLYIAYNPLLVQNVQEQFSQLVDSNNPKITSIFQFKSFKQLCLEILQENNYTYLPEDEVNFHVFEKIYLRKERQKYPTALVWDEIRSIIKGSQLSLNKDYLSKDEYDNLGQKRSTVVRADQRSIVYSIAEWYQSKLQQEGRFDEIDLTRRVLEIVNEKNILGYQLIVCDEIQDFTELQLKLLMKLVAPNGNLFFAGDLHQMISPSGFRWEDLSRQFFEHGRQKPRQETLRFNFRSVGSLANLANHVLKLRYRLLNQSFPDITQFDNNYGELARLILVKSQQLESTLGKLNSGDAILVRTNPEREHLRKAFHSSLVFTIEEAKGLEFDTVFLVEFFKHRSALWHKTLECSARLKDSEKPGLLLELNLLYVAITRARRILNVCEENMSPVWKEPELVNNCQFQEISAVIENRFGATTEDWQQRGEYYLKAEFYLQAVECFSKSGDRLKHLQAKAKLLQIEGQYQEAAEIYSQLEVWETAAQLFQRVKQWKAAADCFLKADKLEQQKICEIHLLEQQGQLATAAIEWESIGQYKEAALLFMKVEQWEKAAICWERLGDFQQKRVCQIKLLEVQQRWEEAAQQWQRFNRFNDERRCWMNSSNEPKKAEYRAKDFEKQKQWLKAFEQYKLAGLASQAKECRRQAVESLIQSGKNKFEEQDYQGALLEYNQALQIQPNHAKAYFHRGLVKVQLKEYIAAIKDYSQAIVINPNYADAYTHRGQVYRFLGEEDINKGKSLQLTTKSRSLA